MLKKIHLDREKIDLHEWYTSAFHDMSSWVTKLEEEEAIASDEVEDQPASIAVYEASGSFYTAFAGSKMKPLQLIIKQRAYYHRSCIRRSLVESERLHLTQPISSTEPKMVISINF